MRKLIINIARYISNVNNYSKDQEKMVEYALRVFLFETLKLVGIIIISLITGYMIEVLVVVLVMYTTKPFIGGYHEDTQIKCFLASSMIIGFIIFLSFDIKIGLVSKLILISIVIFCIWNQAPVMNSKMEINKEKLIKRNRILGVFISIVYGILSLVLYKHRILSNLIIWTLIFQSLLLFNKKINHNY
ncbi:MAG: accessory gene regulator ArgB-like protein [Clostridiaceae bacterium]